VIGTGSARLIDGSAFRIPRIGVYTSKGINMEKHGVQPDVTVEATPGDWVRGIDGQLLRAVDVVGADVREWKRVRAAASNPAVGVNTPPAEPVAPMPRTAPAPAAVGPMRPSAPPTGTIPLAVD
jgi:tricorn protease